MAFQTILNAHFAPDNIKAYPESPWPTHPPCSFVRLFYHLSLNIEQHKVKVIRGIRASCSRINQSINVLFKVQSHHRNGLRALLGSDINTLVT